MSVNITRQQQEAISSRGKVIVSASAGSGKTFVMIERLVRLILGGVSIKRVLAVTFTNKAAAQIKDRLRRAILSRISEADFSTRTRLKQELAALPMAEISTIHSFCSRLVKTYFYLAGTDPAFRVISPDDPDGKLLSARALDETFEECYEQESDSFRLLLSVYFQKKKDAKLRRMVAELYQSVRESADYRERLMSAGGQDGFEEAADYLARNYSRRAEFFRDEAEDLGAYFAEHSERAFGICKEAMDWAGKLVGSDLFAMAETARAGAVFSRMPPLTRLEGEELKKTLRLKSVVSGVKEEYKELSEFSSREEERSRYWSANEIVKALCSVILKYDESYSRLKREAGVLDYNDLEQLALRVLSVPEARQAVRDRFDFVFVDEYQDVNPAQEKLLSLLSGEEVFLVGDAKQSIYGFRGSKSEYFVEKEKSFEHSLSLTENFRSSRAVLEAVNRVFSAAMTEESCGIDYRRAPMQGGSRYKEHEGGVYFRKIPREEQPVRERGIYSVLQGGERKSDPQAEAIADLIAEEIGSEWYDADAGYVRPVSFGDIAVLVRKKTGDAEKIVFALSSRGIPVTTTASVNVIDFWEARLILDWLSYLDNTEQDIPMAGAMLSSAGGFTDGELMQIRRKFPEEETFRAACVRYARETDGIGSKLREFFARTERYCAFAQVMTAAQTADLLLSEGLEAEIAAKQDGQVRLRRVRRLLEEGNCPTNEFLRLIKAAEKVEYSQAGGEDAVKVLSMHSVKGLEYPIVILASLDAPFHGPDRDDVLYTDRFLFAPKYYDLAERTVYETVLRRASALYQEKEERKGELNLLYVAMTRAKYRLYLFFEREEDCLRPEEAKRFSDFISPEFCAEYYSEGKPALNPLPRAALAFKPDETLLEMISSVYEKEYAYSESVLLPVKSSATELMREEKVSRRGSGGGGNVEEGLSYHAFLEHADFGKDPLEELERMRREGILSEEQLSLLDGEKLRGIFALPAIRALAGKKLRREQKFLVLLPACEAMQTSSRDEIVLQGAIDLLCEDEEGYLILDYKASSHSKEELKERYARQIAIYRRAAGRILNTDPEKIRAKIVNIKLLEEIEM